MFVIGDSKESRNAQYILDYQDYDPGAAISLPTTASERLTLVTSLLLRLFSEYGAIRVVICLTVCNQVDSVQQVKPESLANVLHADCARESPPCRIYIVER